MISVNKHNLKIHGNGLDLATEFSVIVAGLIKAGFSVEDIVFSVSIGLVHSKDLPESSDGNELVEKVMEEIGRRNAQKDKSIADTKES